MQSKLTELEVRTPKDEIQIQEIKDEIETLESNIYFLHNQTSHKDNLKVFIIKDKSIEAYRLAEQASIIGDTVGDPLKDTSGPSLNILIKLSSIISVVFGSLFVSTAFLKSWT